MPFPKHLRLTIAGIMTHVRDEHINTGTYDKDTAWRDAQRRFEELHPDLVEATKQELYNDGFRTIGDWTLRFDKQELSLPVDAGDVSDQKLVERRIVQLRRKDGRYDAKPTLSMGVTDVVQYLAQLTQNTAAWQRKLDFWGNVYVQLNMLGEGATVQDVVTEADVRAAVGDEFIPDGQMKRDSAA